MLDIATLAAVIAYAMGVLVLAKAMSINNLEDDYDMHRSERHAALEYIQLAAQVEPLPSERRVMHWAVQKVDEILSQIHMAGITHDQATAKLYELGVCRDRVAALLAGERRAA